MQTNIWGERFIFPCLRALLLLSFAGHMFAARSKTMKALETVLYGQQRTGVKKGKKPREEDFGEAMHKTSRSSRKSGIMLSSVPMDL
jgi:hypothetical protein